jgi:hypothetical protein
MGEVTSRDENYARTEEEEKGLLGTTAPFPSHHLGRPGKRKSEQPTSSPISTATTAGQGKRRGCRSTTTDAGS